MAYYLFGAKPLSQPKLIYFQLDTQEQISVKYKSKYNNFLLGAKPLHETILACFSSGKYFSDILFKIQMFK